MFNAAKLKLPIWINSRTIDMTGFEVLLNKYKKLKFDNSYVAFCDDLFFKWDTLYSVTFSQIVSLDYFENVNIAVVPSGVRRSCLFRRVFGDCLPIAHLAVGVAQW